MKIVHILDHSIPLHSGYTFRSRAIIQQQRALGWQTFHVTGAKHNLAINPESSEEDVDGLHFYRTPVPMGPLSRLPVFDQWSIVQSLARRIDAIVAQVKPDILHAHSPALNGLAAIKVATKYDLPVVYEIRAFWEDAAVDHGTCKEWGIRYRITRALETYVVKRANAVTTICEGLRNEIIERGISSDKVTVIPNAVNIEHFKMGVGPDKALLEHLGLQDSCVLGFIGSFYAYEGLLLLLRALPEILKKNQNVKVLLVGGGPQEDVLKQTAAQLNIADKVVFTGRVPHERVQQYYDLVNIFVYPRTSMRLTELVTPLKPLEAMAHAGVVLASNIGGHRELIENGKTGILFEPGDPEKLAMAVNNMIDNKKGWSVMGKEARNFIEVARNWRASVARYQPVYESLMKKN